MLPSRRMSFLSHAECDAILKSVRNEALEPAQVVGGVSRHRIGDVAWWKRDPHREWLYERIERFGFEYARQVGLDVTDLHDYLQVGAYSAGGHFDWHTDLEEGTRTVTKVTLVVLLSPHAEYDGGNLELVGHAFSVFHRARGSLLMFPATLAHRVTRVTRGTRYSLVAWMNGPPFR